jgi:hypothetical protein
MPGLPVRSLVASAAAAVAGCALTLTVQAQPAPAVRDVPSFAAAMVRIDGDWAIVDEAIEGPTYLLNSVRGDGLTRLDRITANLTAVRTFFNDRSRADAVIAGDDALRAVAALRAELARAEPDQAAAQEEAQLVGDACAACHTRYREGDAAGGFRFKPGIID